MNRTAPARHRQPAQLYARIGLETRVMGARPELLISLLFEGALSAIGQARLHMQNNNIAGRGAAISKAIDIVDSGLKAAVDPAQPGTVAKQLIKTYELIVYHLLMANLHADQSRLDTAAHMLETLAQTWQDITATAEKERS